MQQIIGQAKSRGGEKEGKEGHPGPIFTVEES